MINIILTGGNSQLAQSITNDINIPNNYNILTLTKNELDITKNKNINNIIDKYKPNYIINTASYNFVDKAEEKQKLALKVNAIAVKNLALITKKYNIKLIHISSSYVFDGLSNKGYSEDDFPNPINFYGKSKLLGEKLALENNPNTIIIRTSGLFSKYNNNFFKTIVNLSKEEKMIYMVKDNFINPTYSINLANIILTIIKQNISSGIFHYTNKDILSWYQFAQIIIDKLIESNLIKNKINLIPISYSNYNHETIRPKYALLNSDKIRKIINYSEIPVPQAINDTITNLLDKKNYSI